MVVGALFGILLEYAPIQQVGSLLAHMRMRKFVRGLMLGA